MTQTQCTLADVCRRKLLEAKWLIAPSHRAGHQWIETLVRGGQSAVNLHPTTMLRLALDLVGPELATHGLTVASRTVGPLVVDMTWQRLDRGGYLGQLRPTAELSTTVYESLLALRLAGCSADNIHESDLESVQKAKDIIVLLNAYEEFHRANALVDEADVLRYAIARLQADSEAFARDVLVLIPLGLHAAGLERQFLDALPGAVRVEIEHPAKPLEPSESVSDVRLLAQVATDQVATDQGSSDIEKALPRKDETVEFCRAVGEVNEIRETLRRCLDRGIHLDEIEVLHADAETYIPLIYAIARRYGSDPDRTEGMPVTFAEGIPVSVSRPGRALAAWLYWIHNDHPQRLLVDMIGEGLLSCGADPDLSFSYLVRLLRPISIGLGAENYVPKLKEQIDSLRDAEAKRGASDDRDADRDTWNARKSKGLKTLRGLSKKLVDLSRRVASGSVPVVLQAVEEFLVKHVRSVNELDRNATEALVTQLKDRRLWLERLEVEFDIANWLATLPQQTRVLGSGPRPGHLHVAHIGAGGQSGRQRTIVVGLDDRRFPGSALQDPILLDHERVKVSPELSTSATQLRRKIDELATTLARLPGSLTMSWPCHDLTDDRESFPSSFVLSAYRLISGCHHADLKALNSAVGPPVSFAPTTAGKALDETERWLWRLSADDIQGTDQLAFVEAYFPHLKRGSISWHRQGAEFGAFNGYVPQAGADLNPFSDSGPVLSASALETAGRCPLAFFFRYGLKLYPPNDLEIDPDRWLDAAQFGLLLHDVFRRFMSELSSENRRPQFERDHNRLGEVLQAAVNEWRHAVAPPNENAFRSQYWQLIRSCRIFLQDEEAFCQASQPRFFEVALGVESVGVGSPLDSPDPATVQLPGAKAIRAKGQIDRVDQTANQKYAVWDYKISSGYGYEPGDPFRQGRRVQSVLYRQMIETALRDRLDSDAVVELFGYFFPSIRALGRRIAWDASMLESGLAVLRRLCATIEEGSFVASDNMDDCKFCDYAAICRDTEGVTSRSKELLRRTDLVPLRHFQELRHG